MVNYRGPPKKWTIKEADELRTKPHGYSRDLEGNDIIEELPGLNYNPIPIPTDLIKTVESKKDQEIEQNKKEWDKYLADNRGKIPSTIPKTIFDSNKDE